MSGSMLLCRGCDFLGSRRGSLRTPAVLGAVLLSWPVVERADLAIRALLGGAE